MKKSSVARRYAKALFELLDRDGLAQTRGALVALGSAVTESVQLQHAMASPAFSVEEKTNVLTALGAKVNCPTVCLHFLGQLVKTNRTLFLPEIAQAFGELVDRSKGTQQVEVRSAVPLDAASRDHVQDRLRAALKRELDVSIAVDPSLVSGLQIRIGSTVYDSSVRNRLETMQTILTRG